jgi:hypothetical protein
MTLPYEPTLRDDLDRAHRQNREQQDRAERAERTLAEAMDLLRDWQAWIGSRVASGRATELYERRDALLASHREGEAPAPAWVPEVGDRVVHSDPSILSSPTSEYARSAGTVVSVVPKSAWVEAVVRWDGAGAETLHDAQYLRPLPKPERERPPKMTVHVLHYIDDDVDGEDPMPAVLGVFANKAEAKRIAKKFSYQMTVWHETVDLNEVYEP